MDDLELRIRERELILFCTGKYPTRKAARKVAKTQIEREAQSTYRQTLNADAPDPDGYKGDEN